jgi:hypothetical protein
MSLLREDENVVFKKSERKDIAILLFWTSFMAVQLASAECMAGALELLAAAVELVSRFVNSILRYVLIF